MAANAFTIDVEDWFHICGVDDTLPPASWTTLPSRVVETTHALLEDLQATGASATFFIVGWVAERFPALVSDIVGAGHEVGAHGFWHRRVYELTAEAFSEDLAANVQALHTAGVTQVRGFRAPEWSANQHVPWALTRLRDAGFAFDASRAPVPLVGSSHFPRRPHIIETPAGPIVEVPPFVVTRAGCAYPLGWGWGLRGARPKTVIEAIAAANRTGAPAVLTVHPWEIDPDPPRVQLPPRLAFAHYYRLSGFRARLREVLRDVEFGSISSLAGLPSCAPDLHS